ncbi:MAG: hypothetical protein K2H65_01605, partial [Bacteroidales bacterium]|nr:hypothetical protein [Bacteroidales bacterium]
MSNADAVDFACLGKIDSLLFRNGCTYEYVFGVTGTQEPAVKIDTTICYGGSIVLDVPVASSLIWKDTSATGKRSVTAILGTKSYTATATLAGGCLRDYIFNVTGTQEAPKVKDTSICVGATIRLEIPEAVSLKWKDTALTTGRDVKVKLGRQSDTATVVLEGGCIRDYIFNITGTQEPPLRVDTSVCIGGTLHLDVPDAVLLTWKDTTATGARDVKGVAGVKTYHGEALFENGCSREYIFNVRGQQAEPARVDTLVCEFEPLHLDVPDAALLTWRDDTVKGARDIEVAAGFKQYDAIALYSTGCSREYIFSGTGKKYDTIDVEIVPLFDTVYCSPLNKGEKYVLEAKLKEEDVPVDIQWYKDGEMIIDATARTLDISDLEPGKYEFTVSIRATTMCVVPTEVLSAAYTQMVYERPTVYAGADQPHQAYRETTCIGCDATVEGGTPFTGEGVKPYIYEWSGPYIPATVSAGKPLQFMTGRMEQTAVYTLTATDAMGCVGTDQIKVIVVG